MGEYEKLYGKIENQQYVAMFETGEKGKNYFKYISLNYPKWLIPPPFITMVEQDGFSKRRRNIPVEFVRANTQAEIAACFEISQQQVSRYMKNPNPNAPVTEVKAQDNE